MKISVITASYNSSSTIADTLRSVAEQDYPDIEHIIIDGGSKDNTMEIVRSFPHISIAISEKDKGIYDAMNKGVQRATGDIVAILNSDDFYNSSSVLSAVAFQFRDQNIDAVYGDLQYVKQDNTNIVSRYWRAGKFSPSKFFYGWKHPHPSFFVKIKTMWRQAPITAAVVIAASVFGGDRVAGIGHGLHKVGEVIFGCLVGIGVSLLMSKVWKLKIPK